MNIVLLSGGSGKRLWPLSNDIRSKQFIKIFKTENGEYESMVQRVYRQIKKIDSDAKVTIATSKTQVSAIHNQLGDGVDISVEPCRRDTFPAIALATSYLVDKMGVSAEESVVVCPVDPYVNDDYFEALKKLSDQADKGEANLVLMGIEPTYPSEKYGYIIPEGKDETSKVKTFKEKPTADVAEQYIAQGALWNGGVFAYKLKYHSHERRDEVWVVIAGEGETVVDGMRQSIHTGDVITMAAGCRHTVSATTELRLIEVQLGKEISVADKKKYHE